MCDTAEPSPKRQRTGDKKDVKIEESSSDHGFLTKEELIFTHDGDLRLIIGPEKQPFRVNEWLLNEFCPKLQHGVRQVTVKFRRNSPVKRDVEFPDEDVTAWKLLCGIIHGKRTEHPDTKGQALLELALLAQKLECTDRLLYGIEYYFSDVIDSALDIHDIWQALVAACLFHNSKYFQRLSHGMTVGCKGSFLRFLRCCPADFSGLGLRLCYALEEKRSRDQRRNNVACVLCLDCFSKAKRSFEPNPECASCKSYWA